MEILWIFKMKFKKLEKKLDEEGIIITITNNKNKRLVKSQIILNIDFPKEILNQFTLLDQATIINLEGDMSIKKKRFNGQIINDIEITSFNDEEILQFVKNNYLFNYDIKDISDFLNIVPQNIEFIF